MRKLELKDIIGYLPYDLKCLNIDNELLIIGQLGNICPYYDGDIGLYNECDSIFDYIDNIKPILRPMSDMTKGITVDGYNDCKPFIPSDILSEYLESHSRNDGYQYYCDERLICSISSNLEYDIISDIIDFLNKWHFDYRGLIHEGLAIDINSIE